MGALSSLGIGLTLVSGFLLLALLAELYYLFLWKKRAPNGEMDETEKQSSGSRSPARELLYLFCWKKPHSLSSTALTPQEISGESNVDVLVPFGEEEGMEAELMRLHSLSGPPRFLFTIKEETREELESDDGRSRGGRSRKSSRGRSLSDLMVGSSETPFLTPLSSPPFFTPPLTPLDYYTQQGFNPLFDSAAKCSNSHHEVVKSSPPPKFKFLRDAEEKLYRRTVREAAAKVGKGASESLKSNSEEDGSFITIVIGKSNKEKGHHQPSSSQVRPLPSSPPPTAIRPPAAHGKL